MLELDLILMRFMQQHYDSLTSAQVSSFEALLSHPDPELYAWLVGQTQPKDMELANLVALIRLCHKE